MEVRKSESQRGFGVELLGKRLTEQPPRYADLGAQSFAGKSSRGIQLEYGIRILERERSQNVPMLSASEPSFLAMGISDMVCVKQRGATDLGT